MNFKKLSAMLIALSMMMSFTALAANAPEPTTEIPSVAAENAVLLNTVATNDFTEIRHMETAYYKNFNDSGYANDSAHLYLNGDRVYFDDVFPVIKNGITFVPIRAFTDALGAEIAYNDATTEVSITYNDLAVYFIIGQNTVKLADGTVSTLTTNTFELNGRAMVPVRLISEVFGFKVFWNEMNSEISILDIASLKAGIDTDYTLLDSFLMASATAYDGENIIMTGSFNYDISMKLSETQDLDIEMVYDIESLSNKEALEMAMNISINVDEILETMKVELEKLSTEERKLMDAMIPFIKNIKIDYIFDLENWILYIKSDTINYFMTTFVGLDIADGTWIELNYADFLSADQLKSLQEMAALDPKDITLEVLIDFYIQILSTSNSPYTNQYKAFEAGLMTVKDDKFEKNSDGYALTFDIDGTYANSVIIFQLNTDSDQIVTGYTYDMVVSNGEGDYKTDMSMNFSQKDFDDDEMTFEMKLTSGDTMKLLYTGELATNPTDKVPMSKPDSGKIINFMELVMGLLQ